jgi:hypothetical protein
MNNLLYEPDLEIKSEADFQSRILDICRQLLENQSLKFTCLEGFGFDLCFFIDYPKGPGVRFLELKHNRGQRNGGVGIGNSSGHGAQINLLLKPDCELSIFNSCIRWALMDSTLSHGSERFALFDCFQAKTAVMAGVRPGKQNNLSTARMKNWYLHWNEFIEELQRFLLNG